MHLEKKQSLRQRRIWRIRKKVRGTAERPRLCVTFTNLHIHAQAIDDESGRTLAAASSVSKDQRDAKLRANVAGAAALGKAIWDKGRSESKG